MGDSDDSPADGERTAPEDAISPFLDFGDLRLADTAKPAVGCRESPIVACHPISEDIRRMETAFSSSKSYLTPFSPFR